jgi:uncharacterized membrane protein
MNSISKAKNRIHLLDELRGLAVFCMVFYHAFYITGSTFGISGATELFNFFLPVQPIFAGIFIFISGISCTLSKSNLKRGLILLGIALGMTFVTAFVMPKMGFVECEIYFGILHFLSVSILIYSLLSKRLSVSSVFRGILICAVFYAFTSKIGEGILSYGNLFTLALPEKLYETNYLMPLGFYNSDFFSADYFPIFPDIFIFFAGVFAGKYFISKGYPDWSFENKIPFFSLLGRNALPIYIAHMPVIFGVVYCFEKIINH